MSDFHGSGPAFPTEIGPGNDVGFQSGNERWHEPGMTLRDYFAAKAMPQIYERVESGGFERVAELAYELADAMLKAREA
jgi:hypothetical protein